MALTYTYLIEDLVGNTNIEAVAIHNPIGSGAKLIFIDTTLVSLAQTSEFEVIRYNGEPTWSIAKVEINAFKTDSTQAGAVGKVYLDEGMDTSALTVNWKRGAQTLLDDAGDDTSLAFYVPDDFKPIINAGETITIRLPVGLATYTFNLMIKEVV